MSVTASPERARGVFLTQVVANEPLCREHWRLVVRVEGFPPAEPGQFVQVLCGDPEEDRWQVGPTIRRPFSIGDLRRQELRAELDILHRVVGTGTRWLSQLQPGDEVSIIGPLGNGFPVHPAGSIACLVGGGIGLPPLIWLARTLSRAGHRAVAFCGVRTADLLPLTRRAEVAVSGDEGTLAYREFAESGTPVVLATDDGSLGVKGRIPDVFSKFLERHPSEAASAVVYSCGPEPMLAAVARICQGRSLICHVCLERSMACGMGTCQSCVVRVRDSEARDGWRYRLCCTDGPVFDSRLVIWNR